MYIATSISSLAVVIVNVLPEPTVIADALFVAVVVSPFKYLTETVGDVDEELSSTIPLPAVILVTVPVLLVQFWSLSNKPNGISDKAIWLTTSAIFPAWL